MTEVKVLAEKDELMKNWSLVELLCMNKVLDN